MTKPAKTVDATSVVAFRSQSLNLKNDGGQKKNERLAQLKCMRPVAATVSPTDKAKECADLWGFMSGTVIVAAGVDLSEPVGEIWDAEL